MCLTLGEASSGLPDGRRATAQRALSDFGYPAGLSPCMITPARRFIGMGPQRIEPLGLLVSIEGLDRVRRSIPLGTS